MAGAFGTPYRPPCPGTWPAEPRLYRGSCYQHTKTAEKHVQRMVNQTLVEVSPGVTRAPSDGDSLPPVACTTGEMRFPDRARDGNCYAPHSPAEFADLSLCHKSGWKAVLAEKQWHGRFGFLSTDPSVCTPGTACAGWDSTRYRTIEINVQYAKGVTWTDEPPGTDPIPHWDTTHTFANIHRKLSVAKDSGELSWPTYDQTYGGINLVFDGGTGIYAVTYETASGSADLPLWARPLDSYAQDIGANLRYACGAWIGSSGPSGGVIACILNTADLAAQRACLSSSDAVVSLTGATVANDHLHFVLNCYSPNWGTAIEDYGFWFQITFDVQLSDPYTFTDCYADTVTLLATWDMADDFAHPWRYDGECANVPLVARYEQPARSPDQWLDYWQPDYSNPITDSNGNGPFSHAGDTGQLPTDAPVDWIPTWGWRPYFDPACYSWTYPPGTADPPQDYAAGTLSASTCDGSILGAPLPSHLTLGGVYQPVTYDAPGHYAFGLPHEVDSGGGVFVGAGTGEWKRGALPPNSTWWIPAGEVSTNWPGAYARDGGTYVAVQKWAATRDIHRSINWFRPCGADRDIVDQSDARYSAAYGVDYCTWLASPGDNPPLYLWDGHDASHPPAWPICGRCKVASAAVASGVVTVTLADPAPYLRAGDSVDLLDYDSSFAEVAGSTVTVASVAGGGGSFTYSGTSTPAQGWVKSTGAPHFKWDDDQPKGSFTYHKWLTDICASTTADPVCEDGCILSKVCDPTVVCISPNTGTGQDAFKNGVTLAPVAISRNQFWQGYIVTEIDDPLWQTPHVSCADGTPSTETAPRVEAMCEPPAGAPTPPFTLPCPGANPCQPPYAGTCYGGDIWIGGT